MAVTRPLAESSPKYSAAAEMYEGIYGKGRDSRNAVLDSLGEHSESAGQAMENYQRLMGSADASAVDKDLALNLFNEARNNQNTAYSAYRALPEEVDAWATGSRVREFW